MVSFIPSPNSLAPASNKKSCSPLGNNSLYFVRLCGVEILSLTPVGSFPPGTLAESFPWDGLGEQLGQWAPSSLGRLWGLPFLSHPLIFAGSLGL